MQNNPFNSANQGRYRCDKPKYERIFLQNKNWGPEINFPRGLFLDDKKTCKYQSFAIFNLIYCILGILEHNNCN